MSKRFCALGCSSFKKLFIFPSLEKDFKRRKVWLDFFDIEEPNCYAVFACEKHFSKLQTTTNGLRNNAVPDIPTICDATVYPYKRKPKNWRTNVIVVTPRDPEFTIYRHETGIFPQNLFNNIETSQPMLQVPIISKVSCSMASQTNTRFCGLVQISDIKEEYCLNCFYCSEMFPIENWSVFIKHLKTTHFEIEETFKPSKYISQDHDYTSVCSPNVESTITTSSIKENSMRKSINLLPTPPAVCQPPPLLLKPVQYIDTPITVFKKNEITLPLLHPKPLQTNKTSFNISAADQVIKLLNETLLSPKFLHTEEDNILIIKNTGSDHIETSNFLKNLVNSGSEFYIPPQKSEKKATLNLPSSSLKPTRTVYTINNGLQAIPSGRNSLSRILFPQLPKTKTVKLVQKRIAQQALKNIDFFESVYTTVKKRYPKVVEIARMKDPNASKVCDQKMTKATSRKRSSSEATEMAKKVSKESTEIIFEYTPRDIVVSLLESMKNYPVLWEFHDESFNKDYKKAIDELCRVINDKWSLNISPLKMRRSVHRILRFYRFLSPCDEIGQFSDYFDICALFLPSPASTIPRARCVYCALCFEKDSDLRKHIIARHNATKWHYKCQECLERFRERDEYELHQMLPHYEERFKCEKCDKIFNRRHLYNKHVASHVRAIERRIETSKPNYQRVYYECDKCKSKFTSADVLRRHKSVRHTQQITYKCHLCPKLFSLKSSLKLHLKRHNKELDYICEVCGKCFLRKSSLEHHMETHTGVKITCNICNLQLRKCNLLRHLRLVHIAAEGTIESTFRAKSYHYTKNFNTRRKRRRTEKPRNYGCKICKIRFERLKQLKDHNKQAHFDNKRTACKMCAVEFIHKQNLKRHYRCKHKLHAYQAFLLADREEDLNKVLSMKTEEMDALMPSAAFTQNNEINLKPETFCQEDTMRSDEIQDEIMKAVESLAKQEVKGEDHSMNDFFSDLLN